jgi:hypothetical protein
MLTENDYGQVRSEPWLLNYFDQIQSIGLKLVETTISVASNVDKMAEITNHFLNSIA